jgi:FkbM family methyltransferase
MKFFLKSVLKKFGYNIHKVNRENNLLTDPFLMQKYLAEELHKDHLTVFDVVAFNGEVSVNYSRLLPKATIFSFEPFMDSYNLLLSKAQMNKKIKPFNFALSDVSGNQVLHVNSHTATNSFYETTLEADQIWGNENLLTLSHKTEIKTKTIDEISMEFGLNTIDILKIDTQGTEIRVLKGAKRMLSEKKILIIYLEILIKETYNGQGTLDEIHKMLIDNNYELVSFYNNSYTKDLILRQTDAIYKLKH